MNEPKTVPEMLDAAETPEQFLGVLQGVFSTLERLRDRVACADENPIIAGGRCNGDHREGLHHNDEGFFWGPV